MRNLEVLEEHLQKKELELLHYCLVKWVKFMLRCKAEKSYEKKIVHKVSLQIWNLAQFIHNNATLISKA